MSANRGVAQIKPTNNGLYTAVYDSKGHKTDQITKTLSVTKTATLGNNKFYLVEDYNKAVKNTVGLNKVMFFITLLRHQ